jgi:catalase-peroxidase
MRGGANGARIRLSPMAEWDVNVRSGVGEVISVLDAIRADFDDSQTTGKRISLADLIVLAGAAAIEKAAGDAGHELVVPFTPGRTDATQEMTEIGSVDYLEPRSDGFRNYHQKGAVLAPEHMLVDRAFMLDLAAPEMAVLLGGLRVLGANADDSRAGVLTDRPGLLTNDFFVNLLDMGTIWEATDDDETSFVGRDRATGATRWTATRFDLVFGSNSELRALAEVYAQDDAAATFADDFVAAWDKVMMNDRFDV